MSDLVSKGKAAAKTILKARILLKTDQSEDGEGWSDEQICEAPRVELQLPIHDGHTRVRLRPEYRRID